MSCGNPHEMPCDEVLDRVYEFLDNEIPDSYHRAKIEQHLEECRPCLERYGLDQAIKELVRRSCGHDEVPSDLRSKIMARIREARGTVESPGML